MSEKNVEIKQSLNVVRVDLSAPIRIKTQEERKTIRERIFHERRAAFDMLAQY